jgi:hypothetical protein
MVVAEEIRSSQPCTGAAVAGTGLREEGDDRWGRPGRGRREERALERGAEGNGLGGRARPTWGGGKERRGMGCRAAEGKREGEKGWAGVAHAGVRRGKGARERERELGCWALFPLPPLFFFFSTLKLFKQSI